jgi:hypothetical protein
MSLQLSVGRQTRRRSSQTVTQGGDVGGRGAPHCCKPLRGNAELVVRQSPACEDMNTEADESTALENVTRQPVKSQQT